MGTKLVKCKACGKEIAKGVKKCPSCGKKQGIPFILKFGILLGIIIIIVIISNIGKKKEVVIKYSINDTVKVNNIEWTLLSAKNSGKYLKSNNFMENDKKTAGTFIKVSYKVNNKGNEEYSPNMFIERNIPVLVDGQGRVFKEIESVYAFLNEGCVSPNMASDISIQPGFSKTYYMIFEIPEDAKNLDFKFENKLASTGL